MADLKISQLDEVVTPIQTDLLAIVDTSNVELKTKKVTVQNLLSGATGNGLPAGSEFFIVSAGTAAPDGEKYYCINTDDPGVPFMQGEIMGE